MDFNIEIRKVSIFLSGFVEFLENFSPSSSQSIIIGD